MKKKSHGIKKAHELLNVASQQLNKAAVASWGPQDPAECVTFAFYAYENSVVAAAEALGRRWTKNHYDKAVLAGKLARERKLKTNVSTELTKLNHLRKDVSYGEPGDELCQVDLEDLVAELENFIDEVRDLVSSLEGN